MVDEERITIHASHNYRNCCFNFPVSSSSSTLWDRIRVGESENKWWATPIKAIKKIREWSEIVAGPKWKTFIRRFNRNNRHSHGHGSPGKFQYDPLSYALNFDEGQGQGQNGHSDEEGFVENYPDFSARLSARSSMDLGKSGRVR